MYKNSTHTSIIIISSLFACKNKIVKITNLVVSTVARI